MTLFVYGADSRPTWYVGSNVTLQSSSSTALVYSGPLYTTTGNFFGGAFNPSSVTVRQVGTVTFTVTTPVRGTLTYTVDGVTVSKSVQRQAFKHINLSGTYYGAMDVLSSSTCTPLPASAATPFFSTQAITATVNAAGSGGNVTITFTDTGTSTFTGTYTQYGVLYEVTGTLLTGGITYTAAIRDFTADDDGIRGNLIAQAAGGCLLNFRFAAVRPG